MRPQSLLRYVSPVAEQYEAVVNADVKSESVALTIASAATLSAASLVIPSDLMLPSRWHVTAHARGDS